MASNPIRRERFARVRALLRTPFASLPSRIITSVFSAALVTSVAVTWTATSATEHFLQSQIGQRFPAVLERVGERLEAWYGQRERDLDTFARAETVIGSLGATQRAQGEAHRYLSYVKEGFPQYRALFVLDEAGAPRVWVGESPTLPPTLLASLARTEETRTGGVHRVAGESVQFVSAPLTGPDGRRGSLHAMIGLDAVQGMIASASDDSRMARIAAITDAGEPVAQSSDEPRVGPVPALHAGDAVQEYVDAEGAHWVGSARRFGRFDWILVVEEPYEVAFAPVVSVIRNTLAINLAIVLVFGGVALLIARSIVRPIRALSDGARRIAKGETKVEIPAIPGQDEIGVLSGALREMVTRMQRNQLELEGKNEELRRGNELLEQLSFTDGLTRLHNHRYFQDRLRVEVRRADRTGEQLALLLVDIDDFKALNDRHGHAVGDQVLRQVGGMLNEVVRDSDLPARYGGEEFVVLAPHTGKVGALSLAEKLRAAIARARFDNESEGATGVVVTVSVGVSVYGGDARRLFNDADRALYQAKATGKDCVVFAGDVDEAS